MKKPKMKERSKDKPKEGEILAENPVGKRKSRKGKYLSGISALKNPDW
jgi:hypothetical protein